MAEANNIEVKNNDRGPRYVHTARGAEVIAAGATLSTVASDDQLKAIRESFMDDDQEVAMLDVNYVKAAKSDTGKKATKAERDAAAAARKEADEALKALNVPTLRTTAENEGVATGDIAEAGDDAPALIALIVAKRDAAGQ